MWTEVKSPADRRAVCAVQHGGTDPNVNEVKMDCMFMPQKQSKLHKYCDVPLGWTL